MCPSATPVLGQSEEHLEHLTFQTSVHPNLLSSMANMKFLPSHCFMIHRFPFSRPELLKEWVLNIGRVNFKPKQHTVICSEHFRPECFSAFGNRKNLKHNAVPTVFAFQNPAQVCPEVGAGGDRTLEELQPPDTEGPVKQVLPERTEAMEASGLPAGPIGLERPFPGQPSDHSYALLDLDTLKKKLFLTLKENKRLRKRLRAQRLLLRRTCSRLRAYRGGQRGPRARRPAQQN